MKVRIVKCTNQNMWYRGQIGSILTVDEKGGKFYPFLYLLSDDKPKLFEIDPCDCEILPEENQPEPFDLERALKGEPIQTKSGKIAKSLGAGRSKEYNGIAVEIDSEIRIYGRSGVWDTFNDKEALIMAPRESEYVTKWVNVYDYHVTDNSIRCSHAYHSKETAVAFSNDSGFIGTFPITFKRPK